MKKSFFLVLTSLLAACTQPEEIVLQSPNDIQTHAEAIKKLSEEDKKLLMAYVMRNEMAAAFNNKDTNAYGITIRQAIERQKSFLSEQKDKQHKADAAATEFAKQYEISFSGFEKTQVPGVGEGINLKFNLKNHSNKTITAIRGSILLTVEGLEQRTALLLEEKFQPELQPQQTGNLGFLTSIDSKMDMIKIAQGTAKVNWQSAEILHSDGSVDKLESKNP